MAKVNLKGKFDAGVVEMEIDGQIIEVKNRIAYKEKEKFAQEYASYVCTIDEENEIMYRDNGSNHAVMLYLLCKYYTNINVSKYASDMGRLHDLLCPHMERIADACIEDWGEAKILAYDYADRVENIYNKQHSLEQKVKKSLGSLLAEGDLLQYLARLRPVNEMMIDMLGREAEAKQESKVTPMFAWAAKKGDDE